LITYIIKELIMVGYTSNEMISTTEIAKKFGQVISMITEHTIEKMGVLKNNKIEAVVISKDEYERLKEIEELAEHYQIYTILKDRIDTPKNDYIDGNEVLKKFNLSID